MSLSYKLRKFLNFRIFWGEGSTILNFINLFFDSREVKRPWDIHFSFLCTFKLNLICLGEKKLSYRGKNSLKKISVASLGSASFKTLSQLSDNKRFENFLTFSGEKSLEVKVLGFRVILDSSLKNKIGKWSEILLTIIHVS